MPVPASWAKIFEFCTGWEHGVTDLAKGPPFSVAGSGFSVQSGVKRAGDYALELNRAGATACSIRYGVWGFSLNVNGVVRFYVWFDTKPTDEQQLFSVDLRFGPTIRLMYDGAANAFKLRQGSAVVTGPAATTGHWIRVELRWHVVDFTSIDADWYIGDDGSPGTLQPHLTGSDTFASGMELVTFGTPSTSGSAYKVYMDDFILAAGDDSDLAYIGDVWPAGDGVVRRLDVLGIGTHVGASNFTMDTGALDGTEWQHLNDVPMDTSTTYVQQDTVGPAYPNQPYLEFFFERWSDLINNFVQGAVGLASYVNDGAGVSGGETHFIDTSRDVFNGPDTDPYSTSNASTTMYVLNDTGFALAAFHDRARAWSHGDIGALRTRVGFASDVTPKPRWHSLCYEVAARIRGTLFGYWDG